MALEDEVKKAVEVMRRGGVILYPTDTIWGIGCDATNAEAVARVYEIKRRSDSKALICLVDSPDRIQHYVADVPAVAWDVMDVADKPLTIILDGARNLAENLLAEDGSVALRVTHEEFSRQLCFRFQKPVVSTSANLSGMPAPGNFSEVSEEIRQAVDYVVDYRRGEKAKAVSSSIIRLGTGGRVEIIRK